MASDKEVLTEYKGLLKITHPDHGGNAKLFHYIRTDYEIFKKVLRINDYLLLMVFIKTGIARCRTLFFLFIC